jgi:hypothetical protein
VALAALLEFILIIANVGTAVVLFPILKRQNEAGALGYVPARLVEGTFIAIGIIASSRSCLCGRRAQLARTLLSARLSSRSMIGRA